MTDKLRVGVVGASGWMAGALAVGIEYDASGISAGRKSEYSTVTGLCDRNSEILRERIAELQLRNARIFDSYEEMLQSDSVDAVVIAVPNNLHADFAVQALEADKHIFLEKPFATTWDDSKKLQEVLQNSEVTTKLDYIMVHYDEQENLRRLIKDGAFGTLASVHFTYRHPIQISQSEEQVWKLSKEITGGAIPMGVCHAISMTIYQVDAAPAEVTCISRPPLLRSFDYETQIDLLITFENGVVAIVQGNIDFAEKYDARHTIIGTGGQFDYLPYNPLESRVNWSSAPMNRPYSADPDFAHHHLDSGDVWKHQCSRTVQDFVQYAIKGEKDPLLGLESPLVRRTEAVIWAAEESARKNGQLVDVTSYMVPK